MEQEMVLASCKLWEMDANELTCPTQTPQPKFFGHWIAMGTCLKWQALFWRWSFLAKLSHGNPTWTHCLVLMFAAALPPTNATCSESVAAFFICAWSCSKSILPGQGNQKSHDSHAKLMKSEHHRSKTQKLIVSCDTSTQEKFQKGKDSRTKKGGRKHVCFYTCQNMCQFPGVGKAALFCYATHATHPLSSTFQFSTHLVTFLVTLFLCLSSSLFGM